MCQKLLIFGVINPIQPNTAQDLLWQLFSFISLQSEKSTFNDLTNLFFFRENTILHTKEHAVHLQLAYLNSQPNV
jgi:hypothetical protein